LHHEAKIIVWAATFHLGRHLPEVDARFSSLTSMGDQIAANLGKSAFIIATTARSGRVGATEFLPPPPATSWETIALARCPRSCFIDLTTPDMPSTLTKISARAIGFRDYIASWSRVVDALIVVEQAEPEKLVE
jgi:erythromycin esterase-like protein